MYIMYIHATTVHSSLFSDVIASQGKWIEPIVPTQKTLAKSTSMFPCVPDAFQLIKKKCCYTSNSSIDRLFAFMAQHQH